MSVKDFPDDIFLFLFIEGQCEDGPEFQILSLGSSRNLKLKGLRQWEFVIC